MGMERRPKWQEMLCKTLNRSMVQHISLESGYCFHTVYLTLRFKITIAVPPVNDTDVYAHDIGLIAIKDEDSGSLVGFNVLVGGGMGMTHGSKKTYARLGEPLGFCVPKEVSEVAEAIMLVQRDNGDRTNRKHARYLLPRRFYDLYSLKYTIDDMGLDEFRRQVEERLGRRIEQPRAHQPFIKNIDDFSGWAQGDDGLYSHTVFIENGKPTHQRTLLMFRASGKPSRTSCQDRLARDCSLYGTDGLWTFPVDWQPASHYYRNYFCPTSSRKGFAGEICA